MKVVVPASRAVLLVWMPLAVAPALLFAQPVDSAPPRSPQAVVVELAASLVAAEKPELAGLLTPSGLRIHLRVPGGREMGDEQQRYGAEQVAVLLSEFLAAVEMRPFDPQAGPRTQPGPGRRVWVEQPAPDPKARQRPHGILHLSVCADGDGEFEHQRWFVGLRETGRGWKVEEILHLP